MTQEVLAKMRAPVENFTRMINKSSLDGETEHADLYLNVLDDRVIILQQAAGEVALTYCSFSESYFNELEVFRDIETRSTSKDGKEIEYETGAEAIVNVEDVLAYMSFASDGSDMVEISLLGDDSERLAIYLKAEGALETQVRLPGGEDALSSVPQWLPSRFSENDVFTNPDGDEAPTIIDTNSSKLRTIIDAVEQDANVEYYPLVVEDGQFKISVGEDEGSYVQGTLGAQNVSGPDIENYYFAGFKEITNVMSGRVQLQTAPGNNPCSMVHNGEDGSVIRHVNGSVTV